MPENIAGKEPPIDSDASLNQIPDIAKIKSYAKNYFGEAEIGSSLMSLVRYLSKFRLLRSLANSS